jgi:hypothetical protein
MPASSPEAIARKAARHAARRKERIASDPDYRARLNARRSPEAKARRQAAITAKARARADARPFIGCDGEGIGRGADHRYALFRMGDRELYAGDRRLTTLELLRFITEHPSREDILVAFAFDYDVSNILRDMPADRLRQLMQLSDPDDPATALKNPYAANGAGGWTWFRPGGGAAIYGVQYIPRNHLRVCRGISARSQGEWRTYAMPGTTRTIYDSWGFYQGSFLAALNRWDIGAEHWPAIKAGKDGRSSFETISDDVRRYCAIECDLLAQMMEAFRIACHGAGIRPRTWNGAGKLASALMRDNKVTRRSELEARLKPGLLKMAHAAYYGGRFEVTRCGVIETTVNEYDINSAYPAAMLKLPCLEHGTWRRASGLELKASRGLYVAPCHFTHKDDAFLCGLPFRSPHDGRLAWPRNGRGVYWSPEIRSAIAIGATVKLGDGWLYEQRCACKPFAWIAALYDHRRQLGKDKRGQPLKLGINSVYGKFAQRIGNPPYANPIYAGLCTAITRATINHAIAAAGAHNVLMIATDAIYTTGRRPRLELGGGLGQWEHKAHRSLFIVRAGLYWPPKPRDKKWTVKTRGLSPKYFEPMVATFRRSWSTYCRRAQRLGRGWSHHFSPHLAVKVTTFVGLRLALHMGRPELACQWIERPLNLRFECDSGGKRGRHRWHKRSLILAARAGDDRLWSATYEPGKPLATAAQWDAERIALEAMPDPPELSPPFVD